MSSAWRELDKASFPALQQFQCAEPWPIVPGGKRKLPQHPRVYEWHAQRSLRSVSTLAKDGDQVWVLEDDGEWLAAMHLRFMRGGDELEVVLESVGVALQRRRDDGPSYGDDIMSQAEVAARTAADTAIQTLVLSGWIHDDNRASQRMALRNHMEPTLVRDGDYQQWTRYLNRP